VFKGTCLKWKTGFLLESGQWLSCRLTTKASEFNFWQRFSLLKWQDWLWAHPASYPLCSRDSFLGGKYEAWLLSSADLKNVWSYISTLPSVLMAQYSIKHRNKDNFTVHLTRFSIINTFYCVLSEGFFWAVALPPNAGHGLLIIEVSRSHTTHHSW
jgi:hypothetical protein